MDGLYSPSAPFATTIFHTRNAELARLDQLQLIFVIFVLIIAVKSRGSIAAVWKTVE
jgi:hypothetical protein